MADIKIRVSPQTVTEFQRDGAEAVKEIAIAAHDLQVAGAAYSLALAEVNARRAQVKAMSKALAECEEMAHISFVSCGALMAMRQVLEYARADLEVAEESLAAAKAVVDRAELRHAAGDAFSRAIELFSGSIEAPAQHAETVHAETVALEEPQVCEGVPPVEKWSEWEW